MNNIVISKRVDIRDKIYRTRYDLYVDIELQRKITFNPINRIKIEIHWI